MPPKAGRGVGKKKLAGKYRTKKRKAEETEDLEVQTVQEDSTESPTRERRGRKAKKDVSPCPSKTPERSPEGSRSHRSEGSPQRSERSPQQSQESRQHSPSPPPPLLLVTDSPKPWMMKVNIYNFFLVWMGARGVIDFVIYSHTLLSCMYRKGSNDRPCSNERPSPNISPDL